MPDDACRVGLRQGGSHLARVIEQVRQRHSGSVLALVEQLVEGRALDIFHRNEIQARFGIVFVNGNDVGMIQRGGGFGLAREAALIVHRNGRPGDDLKRDPAAQFRIDGFVNRAHAAFPDLAGDLVMRDSLPRSQKIGGSRFSRHGDRREHAGKRRTVDHGGLPGGFDQRIDFGPKPRVSGACLLQVTAAPLRRKLEGLIENLANLGPPPGIAGIVLTSFTRSRFALVHIAKYYITFPGWTQPATGKWRWRGADFN